MDIQHNLNLIHQKIETACKEAKRNQNTVKLLAVSKTKPISRYSFGLSSWTNSLWGKLYARRCRKDPIF